MHLDLDGRKALVCAASKGLGRACAEALAREGCEVTITGRDRAALDSAAAAIAAATGRAVQVAQGDITTPQGRAAALQACPEPDILVNNAGGPPSRNFRAISADEWLAALHANMLAAIAMTVACVDAMSARRFGRIVNITSMAEVRPSMDNVLSSASRSGLAGFVRSVAPQVSQHNVTINNLLPGPFETERLASFPERLAFFSSGPAGRVGQPRELGDACAYLCSAQAGFITGQSLLIDGGFALGADWTASRRS